MKAFFNKSNTLIKNLGIFLGLEVVGLLVIWSILELNMFIYKLLNVQFNTGSWAGDSAIALLLTLILMALVLFMVAWVRSFSGFIKGMK